MYIWPLCFWFKQTKGNIFFLNQNTSNLYGTMWVIICRSRDVVLLRRLFVYGLYFSLASLSHKRGMTNTWKKKGRTDSSICCCCYENAKGTRMRSRGKNCLPSPEWGTGVLCAVMIIRKHFCFSHCADRGTMLTYDFL